MRGMLADKKSPILYGYTGNDLPIYFSADPVLAVGAGGGGAGLGRQAAPSIPGVGANITPNAAPVALSPFNEQGPPAVPAESQISETAATQQMMRQFGFIDDAGAEPRVIMRFPAKANDILLSGALAGGEALTRRPLALDVPLGQGHVVMFALRPFWRWQSQGTYMLGFNTLMNWDHLDAGKAVLPPNPTARSSDNDTQ